MKRTIFGMMIAIMAIASVHSNTPESKSQCADSHVEWVTKSLEEMQSIKVGMTRRQLKTVFMEEGGTYSREARTYVYHNCQYFKATFRFNLVGDLKNRDENPDDVITDISSPFLQWSHID